MKLSFCSPVILTLLSLILVNASPLLGQTTEPKVKKIPFHGKLLSVDENSQVITIAGKTPRVFHLTSTTRIIDGGGNPSSLSAAVVGEDVGGSYSKDSSGTMTLFSVRFGAKTGSKTSSAKSVAATPTSEPTPPPTPSAATPPPMPSAAPSEEPAAAAPMAASAATTPSAKPKKQTFSGKVVSVDTAANTLVVHGKTEQTFTLTPTTKITAAGGASPDLSTVTPGTKVSGSYVKSADGATLTVYTLKIGK